MNSRKSRQWKENNNIKCACFALFPVGSCGCVFKRNFFSIFHISLLWILKFSNFSPSLPYYLFELLVSCSQVVSLESFFDFLSQYRRHRQLKDLQHKIISPHSHFFLWIEFKYQRKWTSTIAEGTYVWIYLWKCKLIHSICVKSRWLILIVVGMSTTWISSTICVKFKEQKQSITESLTSCK